MLKGGCVSIEIFFKKEIKRNIKKESHKGSKNDFVHFFKLQNVFEA